MEIISNSQTTRALDRQPLKIIVQAPWLDSRGCTEKKSGCCCWRGRSLVSEADHMWSLRSRCLGALVSWCLELLPVDSGTLYSHVISQPVLSAPANNFWTANIRESLQRQHQFHRGWLPVSRLDTWQGHCPVPLLRQLVPRPCVCAAMPATTRLPSLRRTTSASSSLRVPWLLQCQRML